MVKTQRINIYNALVPASRALNTDSDVIDLANYQECSFFIVKGAGAVGTGTITVEACDDATPNNVTAIEFQYRRMVAATGPDAWGALATATAAGFATTAAANDMYEIVVDPAKVAAASVNGAIGNRYVQLGIAQVDATVVLVGVVAVLGKPRYISDAVVTAEA